MNQKYKKKNFEKSSKYPLKIIEYFKIYSFLYYIVLALKIDSKNFALTLVKVSKRGYGWLAWVRLGIHRNIGGYMSMKITWIILLYKVVWIFCLYIEFLLNRLSSQFQKNFTVVLGWFYVIIFSNLSLGMVLSFFTTTLQVP